MGEMTLRDIADTLKHIDFVMLHTHTEGGRIAARPMSNNRDVEYDGDSWFFVDAESRTFADVTEDPNVTLSAQGAKGLLGKPPLFISIEGEAEVIRERSVLESHWTDDLKRWWPQGPESPQLAMLKVHALRIHYWAGEDQGDVSI